MGGRPDLLAEELEICVVCNVTSFDRSYRSVPPALKRQEFCARAPRGRLHLWQSLLWLCLLLCDGQVLLMKIKMGGQRGSLTIYTNGMRLRLTECERMHASSWMADTGRRLTNAALSAIARRLAASDLARALRRVARSWWRSVQTSPSRHNPDTAASVLPCTPVPPAILKTQTTTAEKPPVAPMR